jgi:hypothetical protein
MIEFYNWTSVPEDFTGVCKVTYDKSIRFYKDGNLHNENGPAVKSNFCKKWFINGKVHREDGPAVWREDGSKDWYFKDKCYGSDNDFTIETWKEKVEYLKREDELKVFI